MLLVTGLIIIACDNSLLNQLYAANLLLMQSPLLLIWSVAAVIIYSFILAFFIAGAYLNNRLISILMVLALFGYYLSNAYEMYRIRDFGFRPDGLPWYIPLVTMMGAMIAVKFGLLYLNKISWIIKAIYIVTISVISFFWMILANQLPIFMLLPLLLIFSFPLMAYQQCTLQKRYEARGAKINIPWKLITLVALVFILFATYTKLLNQRLSSKLRQAIELCKTINKVPELKTKINIALLVAEQEPDKEKIIKLFNAYYLKKYGEVPNVNNILTGTTTYYRLRIFFRDIIDSAIKQKKYTDAFRYYLFFLKLNLLNNRGHGFNLLYKLRYILQYYSPTTIELRQLNKLLREVESKNIIYIQREINDVLLTWKTGDVLIEKYQYSYIDLEQKNFREFSLNTFAEVALAPLDISRKINYSADTLKSIKALRFLQGKWNNNNILSVKTYPSYANYHNFLLSRLQQQQYTKIYVATLQYRNKYGKSPKTPKLLVPEFLAKQELYTSYGYNSWYRLKKIGKHNQPVPVLIPITMKQVKRYILLGTL